LIQKTCGAKRYAEGRGVFVAIAISKLMTQILVAFARTRIWGIIISQSKSEDIILNET
jgi:hypothetical protein